MVFTVRYMNVKKCDPDKKAYELDEEIRRRNYETTCVLSTWKMKSNSSEQSSPPVELFVINWELSNCFANFIQLKILFRRTFARDLQSEKFCNIVSHRPHPLLVVMVVVEAEDDDVTMAPIAIASLAWCLYGCSYSALCVHATFHRRSEPVKAGAAMEDKHNHIRFDSTHIFFAGPVDGSRLDKSCLVR